MFENVVPFTQETLEQCRLKKTIRDGIKTRVSKFDIIVLPEKIDKTSGYHPSCYRWFCAVREKKNHLAPTRCKKLLNSHKDYIREHY